MSTSQTFSRATEPQASGPVLTDAPSPQYNVSIGYLRAFITVLVVAHHAVLAYHPFAPPSPANLVAQPRYWQAFPVVDPPVGSGGRCWWASTTCSSCR